MPKDDRPLPKPPQTPFGRKGAQSSHVEEDLVADKMSVAMAKGKLDSFIESEFNGNENATKLASMMMGMTGMGQGFAPPSAARPPEASEPENSGSDEEIKGIAPSEEIMKATMSGDVKKLTALLKEAAAGMGGGSAKNSPHIISEGAGAQESASDNDAQQAGTSDGYMEKQQLEKLIRMASENSVSVDWLINRAIKLYLQDYKNTGRM